MTTDRSDVDRVRAELAATLDAIEHKLNVPKRAAEHVKQLAAEKPLVLAAGVAGVLAAVGGIVWGVVRLNRR